MARLAIPLMLLALLTEYVMMYQFSKHYAKLAFVPFLSREEPLAPRSPTAAGYREVVAQRWTIAELGLEGLRHDDEESLGRWEDGAGWLRMKYKFIGWNRTMGVVSIVPTITGDTLRLRAYLYPGFAVSVLPIALMVPDVRYALGLLAAALVGGVVGVLMLRQRARASLSVFLDSIEVRAQRTLVRRQGR